MVDLRKEAKGRECQVRISGICNRNPETVVLAHYRMAGLTGIGQKANDMFGAWACSACHDVLDGRRYVEYYDKTELRLAHCEAIFRTQQILINEGKL